MKTSLGLRLLRTEYGRHHLYGFQRKRAEDFPCLFGVGKSQRPFHGDPVRICMRSPAPDSSAEWVRLRGSLLCAFGEETAELDPVTFFLEKEEARVRVPASDSSGKEVTLSLKKYPEAWGLKVEGDMDFHFSSFLVRDEEGMVLPEYAWRQGSSFFPVPGRKVEKADFGRQGTSYRRRSVP